MKNCCSIVSEEPTVETKIETRNITSISIPKMRKNAVSQSLKNPPYLVYVLGVEILLILLASFFVSSVGS